jgi:hypothetical protein
MRAAWPLRWSHGHGTVEAMGGMLGPVHFRLPDGAEVQPFAVFPWADEAPPPGQRAPQGLLSRGRGEWPCVPFGNNPVAAALGWPHPIHGDAAHGLWERLDDGHDPDEVRLRFTYPEHSPLHSLERHLRGEDGVAAVACRLVVHARRPCHLPLGLHPTLRVPRQAGALRLEPGRFQYARSYPQAVEAGADVLAADRVFQRLDQAPRQGGGTVDLSAFPLQARSESVLQLCGVDGSMAVHNLDEGYHFALTWDARQLPSCLVWVSNAGRSAWPWSQRTFALGLEPVCSCFDLGVAASTARNPIADSGIATAMELSVHTPLVIDYRMAVQ